MEKLPIPSGEHVIVHARTKGLAVALGQPDYLSLASELLEAFRAISCQSIVVPAFTYSFTKTLRFDVAGTPSEVGRFSEEVRTLSGPLRRSLDPVFSVVDVDGYGWTKECVLDAFGPESIWMKWRELNALIVNLDLPHIVATQFHLIEKLAEVPYRFDKAFRGEMLDASGSPHQVEYNYYVRDLERASTWNRELLESELAKSGSLTEFSWHGVRGTWMRARDIEDVLCPIMRRDPSYLLEQSVEDRGNNSTGI